MKKNLKPTNPAAAFISAAEPEPSKQPPDGYKMNPRFVENRTRRMNLLLPPSVADELKALAADQGISVNELANRALKDLLDGQQK